MSEMQMQASRSATIAAVGYDETTQVLAVRFRTTGHRYEYRDVPASLVDELRASESQGTFIATQIRPHYQFRSLEWQPAPQKAPKPAKVATRAAAKASGKPAAPRKNATARPARTRAAKKA